MTNSTTQNTKALANLSRARLLLAEAKSLDEVKHIRDVAVAAAEYARAARLGRDMENDAIEVRLRAERKAGEMLREMPKATGTAGMGRPPLGGTHEAPPKMDTISDIGLTKKESSVFQKLADIPEETFEERIAVIKDESERLSRRALLDVSRLAPMMSSASCEWYTTPDIIAAVIAVMGGIDVDPCSNSHDAPNVPASIHYTVDDDGLSREWIGRVYMNPPYGSEIPRWVDKLITEYESGRTTQAIMLGPSRTDTRWFRALRDFQRCFMFGRVKFNDNVNSAPFPTMLVGIGCNGALFLETMSELGDVYERVR